MSNEKTDSKSDFEFYFWTYILSILFKIKKYNRFFLIQYCIYYNDYASCGHIKKINEYVFIKNAKKV